MIFLVDGVPLDHFDVLNVFNHFLKSVFYLQASSQKTFWWTSITGLPECLTLKRFYMLDLPV